MKITHTKRAANPIQSSETITCGILDSLSKYLQNLPNALLSSLTNKLKGAINEGLGIDKVEEGKNGIFYMRVTAPSAELYEQDPDKAMQDKNLYKFAVKCSPVKGKDGHYDMSFLTNDGQLDDGVLDVPKDQIVDRIKDMVEAAGGLLHSAVDDEGNERYNPQTEDESQAESPKTAAEGEQE